MNLIKYIKSKSRIAAIIYTLQDLFRKRTIDKQYEDLSDYWKKRIEKVCAAEINPLIERVPNAGTIAHGYQVMHNGLKVRIGSYYGYGESFDATHLMLQMNKGVHEPEEEYYFKEVLRRLGDNAVMIELGAYWSYYSMWFNKEIKGAKNYMIEPDARSLYSGKQNFSSNGLKGHFFQFFIGAASDKSTIPLTISIDDFLARQQLNKVDILHCDIQGYELDMLAGAVNALKKKAVEYIFISTHSQELHKNCISFLNEYGYLIYKEIDLDTISSFDGLIVATKK
ncbi:MAG: FkbM family methyltransferase [Chitinophagaceae bacterium]